ncbi:hypothetical protein BX666DRAFT_1970762 [Dichotomocladium elegans]|nr:hypothetical protein BX666DRAFT_1970762 [Dichotomocladium elegans]
MLIGHKSPIAALCVINAAEKSADMSSDAVLVSASEDGEIARWSTADGRCLGVNPTGFQGVPQNLKAFSQGKYVVCSGQSNDIRILNSTTLEIVRVWGGHSNWVMCTDFYDTVVERTRWVTLTTDARLDIWEFDPVRLEFEKDRSVRNPPLLIQNNSNDRLLHIVGSSRFQGLCMALTHRQATIFVLRGSTFVPEITIHADPDTTWAGGDFCGRSKFVIWAQNGKIFEYDLIPPQGVQPGSMPSQEQQLYYSASLKHTYFFNTVNNRSPNQRITAVYDDHDSLTVVTFTNDEDRSTFSVNPLDCDSTEEVHSTEKSLHDIWPLRQNKDPQFGNITSTIPVSSNHLAIGYESGTICVVPISIALLHLPDLSRIINQQHGVRIFKRAHNGAVTCMIVHESHHHQYLLSGGRDGAVKIWNLIDGKYVVSFTVHALPVISFIDPVEQTDSRIKGCVVSVAKDNSVSLISVDSMACLFMIPGHSYPLASIQWRSLEDYIVLGYQDETAFVWQIASASLDRVLRGKQAKDILDDSRWPINHIKDSTTLKSPVGHRLNVTMRSITSVDHAMHTSTHFAHVFTFNIRRLVHELYARYEKMSDRGIAVPPVPQQSVSATSFDAIVPEVVTPFGTPVRDDPLDDANLDDGSINGSGSELKKALELIAAVMDASISWNVSQAFEDACSAILYLQKFTDHPSITYGLKGANGNLSILAPMVDKAEAWKVSQVMTASRLLAIALLAKAIICVKGQDAKASDLIAGYSMALPAVVGKSYCSPSLSLLSKYWQDPSARSLFSSAIAGLSEQEIISLVAYWENYLPTSNSQDSQGPQMMARATIVLGIMGCDQPQLLSPRVRKFTALSLAFLLSDSDLDDTKTQHTDLSTASIARTLASMELLSQGFTTWESYINAAEVLRTMFLYALDSQAAMSRGANNAIFKIAETNMPLVIGTLTYDATHAKKTDERVRCLKIIGIFIRKKPTLLLGDIHRVVEAVVKTLDPNVPHLRETMLPTATSVLHSLVKTYPFVDFSNSAQKLAVGTLEGASVIYDLRTATRSVVLEGHTGSINALAFSPDAKYVATSSLQDNTVRVWYSNVSLLGVLTSSISQGLTRRNEGDAQKAYKVFSFALPRAIEGPFETLDQIGFEWTSQRCVKLHVSDIVMSFNV